MKGWRQGPLRRGEAGGQGEPPAKCRWDSGSEAEAWYRGLGLVELAGSPHLPLRLPPHLTAREECGLGWKAELEAPCAHYAGQRLCHEVRSKSCSSVVAT